MNEHELRPVVVKVGGSLYDLPDLGLRLRHWLDNNGLVRVVLVPGGGPLVEAIRTMDRSQNLGEGISHLLALQAMSVNALFLVQILPGGAIVKELSACEELWREEKTPILDAYPFILGDEGEPGCLPHSWAVTSDSIAARLAVVLGSDRLILLKSTTLPEGIDWVEAGRRGLVDAYFAEVVQGSGIEVQVVNYRNRWL